MKLLSDRPIRLRRKLVSLLTTCILIILANGSEGQNLPKVLILTGNGNVPSYNEEYPPWIHEFQNEKVIEILKNTAEVEVSSDLNVLHSDFLNEYDLLISNSIFLTPNKEQLDALYQFVANGKSYLTLHCGILSLLNWDRYEEFIGGIFIGGPSDVPEQFKVVTTNSEFWGYKYSFREEAEHPVSTVVEDFITKDELYYFQPSTPDFHVIARAENLPVMWWHPVGKGKIMSLTLGHDEEAKDNLGYQSLLESGVRWLTGMPLIYGAQPKVVSTRHQECENFMTLHASTHLNSPDSIRFQVEDNINPELFTVESTPQGIVNLRLNGKTGKGKFVISATESNGLVSTKEYEVNVVKDGMGNIASYHGNTAISSSNENQSAIFQAMNVLDDDTSTRWSSAATDSAWITIDLQKAYSVRKMVLLWEASFATAYNIQGSLDGVVWRTVAAVSDGDGESDMLEFEPTPARYLKILGTRRANERWGYSLYEVRVYRE